MNASRDHPAGAGRGRSGPSPLVEALHELSNHVHGITMAVQLALTDDAGLPERHRSYLRQIDDRSGELVRLMQQLRAVLRDRGGC